jgi:hypothetical protein
MVEEYLLARGTIIGSPLLALLTLFRKFFHFRAQHKHECDTIVDIGPMASARIREAADSVPVLACRFMTNTNFGNNPWSNDW